MYDICIIGAGAVGAAIARKLSAYKLSLCIVEAQNDVSQGTTKANSAIVHGGYAESHDKLKGRLCYQGRRQFERLNRELNFGFSAIGSFVITEDTSDLPKLHALLENGNKNGAQDLEILTHEQILEMEPNINPKVELALYCKGAGICSPYEYCQALIENAIENGAELYLNHKVTTIYAQDDTFVVEAAGKDPLYAKVVINAAGLGALSISSKLVPPRFEVHPRSGEYLLFRRGSASVIKHVLFQMPSAMGKGILVTPTLYNNLLVGPDAIDEGGQASTKTDVERLAHIFNAALRTCNKINPKDFIRSFAGLRSVASTSDFEISSPLPNYIELAGIQSPGLTSSPAIADMVVEMIGDKSLELSEKPNFNPYRKPIIKTYELMDPKEAEALVQLPEGDPRRLVCRCEQVSEARIKDALSRNIPITTIDALKRRTRCCMGFCQGSFCRPRVAKLLEDALGVPVDPSFDIEHSGISRVGKSEFLDYLKSLEDTGLSS